MLFGSSRYKCPLIAKCLCCSSVWFTIAVRDLYNPSLYSADPWIWPRSDNVQGAGRVRHDCLLYNRHHRTLWHNRAVPHRGRRRKVSTSLNTVYHSRSLPPFILWILWIKAIRNLFCHLIECRYNCLHFQIFMVADCSLLNIYEKKGFYMTTPLFPYLSQSWWC